MPLVAISIRLYKVDEGLLYKAQDGSYWLSCVCVFDTDAKNRTLVAQSIPPERYKAGERGPQVGFWREIGGKDKPPAREGGGFNLAKYKASPTAHKPPGAARYPDGQEGFSPQAAFDGRGTPQQEPNPPEPPGFNEFGF